MAAMSSSRDSGESDVDSEEAVRNSDVDVLTYHSVEAYPNPPLDDRTIVTAREARQAGAVACSECFADDVDAPVYGFPYLESGGEVA